MTKGANLSAFITLPFQAHELHHISPLIHTQIHLLTLPRAFSQQIVMARQERRRPGRLCKRLNGDSEPEVTHKICNKGQSFDVLFSVSFRSHKTIPKNLKKHQPRRQKNPADPCNVLGSKKMLRWPSIVSSAVCQDLSAHIRGIHLHLPCKDSRRWKCMEWTKRRSEHFGLCGSTQKMEI